MWQFINGFRVYRSDDSPVIISCPSDPRKYEEFKKLVKQYNAKGLEFGSFWELPNLCILPDFPELEYIRVESRYVDFLGGLLCLNKLKSLSIGENVKSELHFQDYPTVENLTIDGLELKNIHYLHILALKELGVGKLKGFTHLSQLAIGPSLEKLWLFENKLEDLQGIERLKKLKRLDISQCRKLNSLSGLEGLSPECQEIEITYCPKLSDLTALSSLAHVEELRLDDCGKIPDLNFISGMKSLKTLYFWNTTVENGDMTPLLDRTWDYIFYKNNKNYTHKHNEIPALKHAEYEG